MDAAYGNLIRYDIVKKWGGELQNGRTEILDKLCQGQPSVINKDSINTERALIEKNGHIAVAEIERYFQDMARDLLLQGTVTEIIPVRLSLCKMGPDMLDDKHK